MSIIDTMLRQTAVWWPLQSSESAGGGDFDEYGQPLLSDPVEISVRWEDRIEEFIDGEGTTQLSNAVVFVDRDVEVGGVLMLGEIADITDLENVKENDGAWEIMRFDKLPTLRATKNLRTAYL